MVNKSDYEGREIEACRKVLVEIIHLLGEFKDDIVLIGGWIPTFLIPQSDEPHVGSLDIDLAFDFTKIPDDTYRTILELLLKRGYTQDEDQPFRFFRDVMMEDGGSIKVEVDLMAGEYGGTGKSRRTQKVQDVSARKVRGCDLAFGSTVTVSIEDFLPEGGKDKVSFKIAGIVPLLDMKGIAMHGRMKEKDAYDIFYCVDHFPGGVDKLIKAFKPFTGNKLVLEGLGKIKSKFASMEHVGPKWVTDFLVVEDDEERSIIKRRAFEKITSLLNRLEIEEWD